MTRTTTTRAGAALAGAMLLALTGCTAAEPEPTSEALPQHTAAELTTIFDDIQFVPDQYASTAAMLESIYPGLTVSDASCLAPFGAGWDTDDTLGDSAVTYGTSTDRSMTSVVASTGDADTASALVGDAEDALERCADGSELFAMQGVPVQTTVEQTQPTLTGTDDALGWTVTGDVGGAPFTLVGITARVGGDVIALVGWDPSTNASYVPQATQLFVDAL
ncbi:hypothetical protein GRS96_01355 [Rathayibacter sp. VKM Ac-2803]|uniref:hypothetical protein n=1 Tax=unclassified Rathayibacter TaxID=2609250 RepID=UPI001357344A|nr:MULTISPECIES: hypothetical protein [unclassified Rathayibacter]MWV47918.1 hypothetical protein [Rathayibacter sp. VKM Ac-2803]MWV58867.1 hypothetical protein [Rathayibacter sp. VKM Ac-2754]